MTKESPKLADVLPVKNSAEGVSTPETLPDRFIWEDLLNAPSERLRFLDRLKDPSFDKQIVARLRDMVLDMGQRKEVDFDTFRDLLASIGIEVVLLEEFVTQKKEETEVAPASEAAVSEAVPEQPMQTPADPLGFSRKTPEFSAPVVEAKPVSQVAQSELLEQTPAPVVEGVSTQEVSGSTPEDAGVTLEDIRAMIDASYSHLSPEDREKVYEAARKELGL